MSHSVINLFLLKALPSDIDYTQNEIDQELINCAVTDDLISLCNCLKMVANVNATHQHDWIAVHGASFNGHGAVVHELLQHENIDVNVTDEGGFNATAHDDAFWVGPTTAPHVDVVHEVLKHQHQNIDANPNTQCRKTTLHVDIDRESNLLKY